MEAPCCAALSPSQAQVVVSWSGKIHKTTADLLLGFEKCVRWRELNVKLRKTKADAIISIFDPLHSALPEDIQALHVKAWEATQDYFVKVAHRAPTSAEEFAKWLSASQVYVH